jgi:O-antigen/teichoic acid export membrane protein
MTEVASKLAGSAGVLILRKVASSGLSAISSIVVVRSLAPGEFGQYAAGLSAFYLLVALTEFGFAEVLGRALGRGRVDEASFGRRLLLINLAWSGLVALAGVVLAGLFAYGSIRGGTLLALTPAIALAGVTSLRQFFYAKHEVGRMATVDLSTAAVSTVVIVTLAVLGAPPVLLAGAASLASVATSLILLRVGWHWISRRSATAPVRYPPGGVIRDALPIGFASFLATAYVSIDVVILSTIFAPDVLGQYASAVKVLSLLTIFPGLVMAVALPQLSADWSDPARLGPLLARLWHWFMSLVLPALVIVAVNAAGVMTILFGAGYAAAGGYVRVLMLAGGVAMLSQLLGVVVVAAARAGWLVAQNIVALVLNVGGNLLLTPRWGIGAAAWLTVATEVLVCAGSALILRDRVPYAALLRVSRIPVAAVAVAATAGSLLGARPWAALLCSGAVYLAVMSAARGWPAELIRMVPAMARSA